jgi:predicted Fe-Mo cluster-binding NifX family protein
LKIAITTSGDNLASPLDSRFGRAARFLVYNTQTDSFELLDNQQNLDAAQGAGIQAAQTVCQAGAEVVITGHCGPKAFRVLQAAGVQIVVGATGTVQLALEQFKNGIIKPADSADVEGHWG